LGRLGTGPVASDKVAVKWGAALIWLAGICVYHAAANWTPQFGAALPTLAFSFALAWFSRPVSSAVSHA
jgi:hypothetical protein